MTTERPTIPLSKWSWKKWLCLLAIAFAGMAVCVAILGAVQGAYDLWFNHR